MEHCLGSVIKASQNIASEIFVVDNNSTDGSKEYLSSKFPNIIFIWNESNEGFAKANNKALKMANGEYILFLNPDTIIAEDTLEKCISFIQSRDNAIACGVKMIDGKGNFLKESKRGFPSPIASFYKLSGLSKLFPKSKVFSKYHLGFLDANSNYEVDVLSGAFMMMPKTILDKTGGFDEDFFMYGEDIDMSYRIQKAGFNNFYFSDTSIIHFKGESTNTNSLRYVKLFYKAMSIFVKKHYGSSRAGLYNFFIQPAIVFRGGMSVVKKIFKSSAKGQRNTEQQRIIAIGNNDEIELLRSKIPYNEIKIINSSEADDTIKFIQKIKSIIAKKNDAQIILSEVSLSFKKIIELLPLLPKENPISFFNGNILISS